VLGWTSFYGLPIGIRGRAYFDERACIEANAFVDGPFIKRDGVIRVDGGVSRSREVE